MKSLGYATSPDGVRWTRHPGNPVFDRLWTEDVFVLKHEGVYQMFAEGTNDVAHRLTSADGLRWEDQGRLDIRTRSGAPLSAGAYGTPTVWVEGGTFYLYYERDDKGIWLATSKDLRVWTNVRDEPVIALGPDAYDRHAVALNQVVRYRGRYYGVYHANADPEWKGPWTTCLAVSDDLVRWEKYPGNPIIRSDDSSGILVDDGQRLRLYTMHPAVKLWLPRGAPPRRRGRRFDADPRRGDCTVVRAHLSPQGVQTDSSARVARPRLELGEPAAGDVQHDHGESRHRIEKRESPHVPVGNRPRAQWMVVEQPARGGPRAHERVPDRDSVDQRDVQQVVREGTRPNTESQRASLPSALSSSGITVIVGPSVISRNSSDAGYLLVFRNASNPGTSTLAAQGLSP